MLGQRACASLCGRRLPGQGRCPASLRPCGLPAGQARPGRAALAVLADNAMPTPQHLELEEEEKDEDEEEGGAGMRQNASKCSRNGGRCAETEATPPAWGGGTGQRPLGTKDTAGRGRSAGQVIGVGWALWAASQPLRRYPGTWSFQVSGKCRFSQDRRRKYRRNSRRKQRRHCAEFRAVANQIVHPIKGEK